MSADKDVRIKPNYIRDGFVDRVIDGDTIVVTVDLGFHMMKSRVHLRLKGMDSPELNDPDPELQEKAQDAKEYVEDLVLGRKIVIRTFKTRYGNYRMSFTRYIADVYFDDENGEQKYLNAEIVDAGHGVWI